MHQDNKASCMIAVSLNYQPAFTFKENTMYIFTNTHFSPSSTARVTKVYSLQVEFSFLLSFTSVKEYEKQPRHLSSEVWFKKLTAYPSKVLHFKCVI